ncbi:MAG: hypothetical protein WCI20_11875 [bacterium]
MEKITITLEIEEEEVAEALAQFVKRCGWTEWRQNAVDDLEASRMRYAFGVLQKALAEQGFAPR